MSVADLFQQLLCGDEALALDHIDNLYNENIGFSPDAIAISFSFSSAVSGL